MSVVDDIKARLDIVDVVSGYVSLNKAGRNFKAPCPFHNEKTPSFVVTPDRQSWRCFGACATGGDIFGFVMRKEGLEFGDALKVLAERAGVELSENKTDSDKRDALYSVNSVAAQFYQDVLTQSGGKQALDYVTKRGLNEDAMSTFQIGASPAEWDGLKNYLEKMGVSEDQSIEAGLLRKSENGRVFDFFRGRLMFPISDSRGRVTGFGARALDDSNPKYLNTGETPIFNKRNTLYGLHLARNAIRTSNTGIVVEGYMDVIAAHQHGYANVVASMGTALTEQQVAQLKTLAKSFVLALDPDVAGQEATLRSLETSWRVIGQQAQASRDNSAGVLYQRDAITLNIAELTEGRDPDELIRHDSTEWERLTADAVPFLDFLIPAIVRRFDVSTGHGKTQVVQTLKPSITAIDNNFDQDHYVNMLAEALQVEVATLRTTLNGLDAPKPKRGRRNQDQEQAPHPADRVSEKSLSSNAESAIEDYILTLLVQNPHLRNDGKAIDSDLFYKTETKQLFTHWLSCTRIDELQDSVDESLSVYLTQVTQKDLVPIDRIGSERALAQCVQRLQKRHLHDMQESLLSTESSSEPPPKDIEADVTRINTRLKELFANKVQ